MNRFILTAAIILFSFAALFSCSKDASVKENAFAQEIASAEKTAENIYEVLSPWAEVDTIPLRGISSRVDSLSGKKIGLFANFKTAAIPIITEVENRLKERFPDIETILFHSTLPNVDESVTENRDKFSAWAKGVDAVVGVVGD